MKREVRGYEARCPEVDPGLMTVLDLEGAEYPGEYWADGVRIKVSEETSNVNFLLSECWVHASQIFCWLQIDVSRTIEGIEIFTLDNNHVSQFRRVLNDLKILSEVSNFQLFDYRIMSG